ncbi:MAG: globin [Henriciella sp.]|uniref:globin n=1 Tax=Henriciella sp. TaxID=1968823 RepID=UPI003C76DC52
MPKIVSPVHSGLKTLMDGALLIETLERVAELRGDPAELVYTHLFEAYPDYEALFVMDQDGGVRGTMLSACFDCIIGLAEKSTMPLLILEAAQLQHDAYDLQGEDLSSMFTAIRDAFRDVLSNEWSQRHEETWHEALLALQEISRKAANQPL